MKKLFTSACLSVCMLLALTHTAFAQTPVYYVTSGQAFKLTPAPNTLAKFFWIVDGTALPEIITSPTVDGSLERTFNQATNAPVIHTIKLSVLNTLQGCVSNVVDYTVVELPKLVVQLNDVVTDVCQGKLPDVTLSASLQVVPGNLADLGVTISPFKWTKGGSAITANLSGANDKDLQVTALGEYFVTVAYQLPTSGVNVPAGQKLGTYVNSVSKTFTATLPAATVPLLTLE